MTQRRDAIHLHESFVRHIHICKVGTPSSLIHCHPPLHLSHPLCIGTLASSQLIGNINVAYVHIVRVIYTQTQKGAWTIGLCDLVVGYACLLYSFDFLISRREEVLWLYIVDRDGDKG